MRRRRGLGGKKKYHVRAQEACWSVVYGVRVVRMASAWRLLGSIMWAEESFWKKWRSRMPCSKLHSRKITLAWVRGPWCRVKENSYKTLLSEGAIVTSLVVQWLRLCAPNAGGLGSIPGERTRSHVPQLRVCMLNEDSPCCNKDQRSKMLSAAPKTQYSQINK